MRRLNRIKIDVIRKKWSSIKYEAAFDDDQHLSFATTWFDELEKTLSKAKNDKEFTSDIFWSASDFFDREMDSDTKRDVFAYLLGKYIRKM